MQRQLWGFLCAGVATAGIALFAQAPAPKPEFEVASIKPAPPLNPAQIQAGKIHIGMNIDGARVDIGGLPMQTLLVQAFDLKPYQITGIGGGAGPTPMALNGGDRWDILAKLPAGATKEQVPAMLVKLLEDRFNLKYHHESKELQVYGLVVGKNGTKLKDTSSDVDAPTDGAVLMNGTGGEVRISQQQGGGGGRGGSATISSPQYGTMKVAMGESGTLRLDASKMTMSGLSELLTSLVDHPVIDMTGMKGTYQVTLDVSMEALMSLARTQGLGGGGGGGFGGAPGGALGANVAVQTASDPSGGGAVFDAVQKLGLKLEPKKAPVDTVVIDHIDKTPTDN
jgi:uncharacterized protein (TIGR03435 family)